MTTPINTSYALKNPQRLAVSNSAATRSTQTSDYIYVYRLAPSADVWGAWGSSTITAQTSAGNTTSFFFPSGNEYYINTNMRYFSFRTVSSTAAFVNIAEATQGD